MLEALLAGFVGLLVLVALPLLLLVGLVKLVLFLVLLPFRVLGALLHAAVGGCSVLLALGLALGALLVLPLLPLVLLGLAVALVVRLARPRPVVARPI